WTRTEFDTTAQKNTTSTFRIGRSDQTNHPPGIMMQLNVKTEADNSVSVQDSKTADYPYFVTCTIPGPSGVSNSYESLFVLWKKEGLTNSSYCLVARYRVRDNILTLYGCATGVGADLIDHGVIAGKVNRGSNGSIDSIMFERDSLIKYLQEHSGDDLFPAGEAREFHRVSGTESSDPTSPVVLSPPSPTVIPSAVDRGLGTPQEQAPNPGGVSAAPNNAPGTPREQEPRPWLMVLPWMILVFIAGVFVGRKFSKP
ncbi:MAG: hypothetical protein JWL77_711, partial [Chthonomonadaceae bacterium]|nr:hypothetical protein [Chthonomonadaceae bacterium]